ncbi:MAG: DUF5050 domain-containing protein [Acidobacteria bacterium]|nr:DUF5050 domain-containing protein [Acidobacteriota bacterium]
MSFENSQLYIFKEFLLDVGEKVLLRNGEEIAITPKAFQLLQILVENHGAIVKKEHLFSEIWTNSFVEEGNLAFTARLLRKVLGDDAKHPVFIETIPRKGYRFIADVSGNAEISADATTPVPKWKSSSIVYNSAIASLLVFSIGAFITIGWYFSKRSAVSTAPILLVPFNVERLTSSGSAVQAVISPNGKLVAYLDQANEKWSIWLKQLSTSENIQITLPSAVIYSGLVFSRDGNSLFFARSDEGKKELNIYRINTFGGIPTKLVEKTEGWISVSPDDKQISFVRCEYSRDNHCSLFVADAGGGNERQIFTSAEPIRIADNQFSPDGRYIAFAAGQSRTGSNEFGLFQVDLSSGDVHEIGSRKFFNIKSLKWLPEGDGLLITARDSNSHKFSIWSVSARSGEANQLTNDDANFSGLSTDASGDLLLATKVDNNFTINHESAKDPSSRKPIAPGADIALAPDGTIVYGSADRDIWTIDKDGNNKRQLTSNPSTDIAPLVSWDGKSIYFTSNRSGVNHIWQMNSDGSSQKQVTQAVGGFARHLSPDGEWLYYKTCLTNSFRKVRTDGRDEQDVPEIDTSVDAFSPDAKFVAYFIDAMSETTGRSIVILDLAKKEPVRVIRIADQRYEPKHLQWSEDGRTLFYLSRDINRFSLWSLPVADSAPKFVADLGSDPIEDVVIGFDGLSVVSSRGKWIHDAFLIRGLKR